MGSAVSTQSFFEKTDEAMEMGAAEPHILKLASKLAKAHGVDEATVAMGLTALEPCVKARLNRPISQPLDLASLRSFKEEMRGQPVAPDVAAALGKLPAAAKARVEQLLDCLHLCGGYLPRVGLGSAMLYKSIPGERVYEQAYSYGVRMTDMMDDAPSMPKFNNAMARDELRDELAGKDLSDFVLVAHPDPFTFGEKPARESLAGAKYLDRGAGEPLVDVYAPLCPARFGPGMVPDVSVNFDEAWKELEQLHREGKVRALGVCNMSAPQLERLLKFCAIRPAVYEAESHILHQQHDVVALCHREKIAVLAHTPLGQGSVLDQACLAHESLTPAQVAIRFNLDRGVSVLPGAMKLSHVEENVKTPLGPVVKRADPPASFVALSMAAINKHFRALIAPTADLVEKDGHWRAQPVEDARPLRKEVITQNAPTIDQLRPIIEALPKRATPAERRKVIADHLAKLGDVAAKDRHLGKMMVVPAEIFEAQPRIPRRSCKDDDITPQVDVADLPEGARVLFFSQRWLTPSHPDDADGTKRKAILAAAAAYATKEQIDVAQVYIWFDVASIEQDDLAELVRGVNALGLYIASCDAFVSIDHAEYWDRAWCLMEQEFARCAGAPRFVLGDQGLEPTDHEITDPMEGNLTVEDDRAAIEVLCLVANDIRARLYLGNVSQFFTDISLDIALDKGMGKVEDDELRHNIIATEG